MGRRRRAVRWAVLTVLWNTGWRTEEIATVLGVTPGTVLAEVQDGRQMGYPITLRHARPKPKQAQPERE